MKKPYKKLAKSSKKLDGWMREQAWPLWWKKGRLDNGAFFEALDFDGEPVPASEARVRVQARQIYSLALAWKLGFRKKSLPRKLGQSIDRFFETCLGEEGLPGMLVDIESGKMTDAQPNLYVTAFTLLALAQSRKVLDAQAVDPKIVRLLKSIDKHLAYDDDDGYREHLPPNNVRLQNPHMHLYESLLTLYKATKDPLVQDRSERLLGFVKHTFFDLRSGVVQEKVNPSLEMAAGDYEPGHSMEWVWLLGWRARLFDVPMDPFAVQLYEKYCSAGIPEGQVPMCLTVDHEPVDPSRRLWSQTESLKAHLAIAELGPPELAELALSRAVKCANTIYGKWLNADCPGTWHDHFDEKDAMIAKDVPASMCYHLYVMIMELKRTTKKLRKMRFD